MMNSLPNIDDETIHRIGLRLSDRKMDASVPPGAKVFHYPGLENVFVMESDLYGNKMPAGSCFLAFNGQHGLIGKHLKIETLRQASLEEIRQMVESNNQG